MKDVLATDIMAPHQRAGNILEWQDDITVANVADGS
jgi:hypothetical protein